MSYYTCVIVNPASANGATGRNWPELRAALDRVLDRWDNQFTIEPGDATRLAAKAAREGYEMIVVVGGDGTMNEVVTGLFEEGEDGPRPIRENLLLGSVRAGTGGDFARFLGLPHALPASVAHLSGDRTRVCDLGWVSYRPHEHEHRAGRGFLNIASFGLSGAVDAKVNNTSKALGGTASFFAGLIRALVAYRPQSVRVEVDGAPFFEGPMITMAIANGQYFGGGMHFAPRAEIDDGLFDVVVQERTGLYEIAHIADLYSGKLIDWPSVRTTRGRVVRAAPVDPAERILLDVDGEQPGVLPAEFRIYPSAIRLKV